MLVSSSRNPVARLGMRFRLTIALASAEAGLTGRGRTVVAASRNPTRISLGAHRACARSKFVYSPLGVLMVPQMHREFDNLLKMKNDRDC